MLTFDRKTTTTETNYSTYTSDDGTVTAYVTKYETKYETKYATTTATSTQTVTATTNTTRTYNDTSTAFKAIKKTRTTNGCTMTQSAKV